MKTLRYFYHPDHLGSSSVSTPLNNHWITDGSGNAIQHLHYLPFGEDWVDQRNASWNAPYTFSGKEKDVETGYSYFGARYYDSGLSIWLSVDPMSDKRCWLSPYNYCQNNPIILIDPDGMLDSEHVDGLGNIIAHYDDGDNSVYQHPTGTTKEQIDKQRAQNQNIGGSGQKVGELGKNINTTGIMSNKLVASALDAYLMTPWDFKKAVTDGGDWDLKTNLNTIWGVAWQYDQKNNTTTTFSFNEYTGMTAADVGNFHYGFTGKCAMMGFGFTDSMLEKQAGKAEIAKNIRQGNYSEAEKGMVQLNSNLRPYGDRVIDNKYIRAGIKEAKSVKSFSLW